MSYSTILYEVEDSILTITLNRPEALNAFNNEMLFELIGACDKADADDNVKAIIITGAGRGFCAGADLSGGGNAKPGRTWIQRNDGSITELKPTDQSDLETGDVFEIETPGGGGFRKY